LNSEILTSFQLVVDYARRLVGDIPPQEFVAQPDGIVNHPAWILGHLAHSFQAIGGEIGVAPWLADDWDRMFATGAIPTPRVKDYPSKSSLIATFDDAVDRTTDAVSRLSTEGFASPLPDDEYRATLPTIGHALLHILVGHTSVHVGQLTVWRHAMQLPRVPEHFDNS
jgi:hypothetical protein